MVTVASSVETLPFTSVTVRVTVLAPTFEQLKLEGDTVIVLIPQASDEKSSTMAAVIEATPVASNATVMSFAFATGLVLSWMVTVASSVETFPFTSVTVRVTVLAPTFEQLNEDGDTVIVLIPQASDEKSSTMAAVMEATPVASRATVMSFAFATGLVLS